jgi:hemerythrin superfamily protein
MDFLKKYWKLLAAAFGTLLGLFLFERSKRQDAEAKLENAEVAGKDAVLESKKEAVQSEIAKTNQNIDQLAKDLQKSKEQNLSNEEIEKFYKDKK